MGTIKRIGVSSSFFLFLIPGMLFWVHINWTVPYFANLFHGLLIHVISIPIYLVMPFVVYKTRNTTTAIFIHALLGFPMQLLVALGFIS